VLEALRVLPVTTVILVTISVLPVLLEPMLLVLPM
jgi:hypothetical protein